VSCRFQIPLHGPTDFVCDPTRPTDIEIEKKVYDQTKSGRARLVEFRQYCTESENDRPTKQTCTV